MGRTKCSTGRFAGTTSSLALVILLLRGVYNVSISTVNFRHSQQLDSLGKYVVYWSHNDTFITFEVRVNTSGYIGFGLSPNGKMYPADVVVGWVKDGIVHFHDYHTTDRGLPKMDKQQDWTLFHGEEHDFGTVLRFGRNLKTCDENDMIITDQTIRLIYAYHPDDPESSDHIVYHGFERRGSKSVSLLSPTFRQNWSYDKDLKILDLTNRDYLVPSKDTTYLCTGFQLDYLSGKHHIVEFEPVLTPGNENYVHHLDILKCRGSFPHLHMATAECLDDWPEGWPLCGENLLAWGTGGGAFYFPEHTGYSIGAENDAVFYIMQLHYNNPARMSGIIDSSGIRLKLTTKLRQHDVSNFMLGHLVTTLQVIPLKEQEFVSKAYCAEQCLTSAMKDANLTEIKVIAAYQHAHTLAVGMATRHLRNGTELAPIIDDPYYDFFFQEIRALREEITVQQGDSFVVECRYNSMNRINATFGGSSSRDEMCLSYLYIYPKVPLIACVSTATYDTFVENDYELQNKFETMNWNDPTVKEEFKEALANSSIMHMCESNRNIQSVMKSYYKFREIDDTQSYTTENQGCTHHSGIQTDTKRNRM